MKTTVKKKTLNPVWEEKFEIEVDSNILELNLKDHDTFGRDVTIDTINILVKDVKQARSGDGYERREFNLNHGTITLSIFFSGKH